MTKHPIADITARLEERLAARLVDRIRPLLAGRSREVRGAVLGELVAWWLEEVPADERTGVIDLWMSCFHGPPWR